MFVRFSIAVAALGLLSSAAFAQGAKPSDPQIAHIAYTAGVIDINAAKQVGSGMLGAFIIEPRRPRAIERADVDYVMVLNDGVHGYTLNGKSFPATGGQR